MQTLKQLIQYFKFYGIVAYMIPVVYAKMLLFICFPSFQCHISTKIFELQFVIKVQEIIYFRCVFTHFSGLTMSFYTSVSSNSNIILYWYLWFYYSITLGNGLNTGLFFSRGFSLHKLRCILCVFVSFIDVFVHLKVLSVCWTLHSSYKTSVSQSTFSDVNKMLCETLWG